MNKLIVVTGGTKGIGKAILQKFAENGFDLITCSRNKEEGKQWMTDFQSRFPGSSIKYFPVDMAKKEEAIKFAKEVIGLGRVPDVLVNNTGYYVPGTILEEAEGILEKMISTNLYSAYHTSRGLIPGMKERGSGHVFNICSIASIVAYANGGSYCISKFAVLGMSKVLREETKSSGVKVTSVLPGAVRTRSWEGTDLPDSRFIRPEDVAECIWTAYALSKGSTVEELIIRPQEGDI